MERADILVLAIDTAMDACSVAVTGGGVSFALSERMERGQAQRLVPMMVEAMEGAGLPFSAIDLIAVTSGPGGFTGVRIGLSAARAAGLAMDKPVVGVTTLEALARQYAGRMVAASSAPVLAVVDTRRDDFYVQPFGPDGSALAASALRDAPAAIEAWPGAFVLIGNAAARLLRIAEGKCRDWGLAAGYEAVDPVILADIGRERFFKEGAGPFPRPVYLREADVSSPKNAQRIICENSAQ